MIEERITIPTELTNSVEERQIELNGLKNMIGFCLSTTDYEIPQEKIDLLQHDFLMKNAEYERLKIKVENIIKDKFSKQPHDWSLDFETNVATVNFEE